MTSLLLRCLYTTQGAGAVCSHTQHARIHFHCMHPLTPSMCFKFISAHLPCSQKLNLTRRGWLPFTTAAPQRSK